MDNGSTVDGSEIKYSLYTTETVTKDYCDGFADGYSRAWQDCWQRMREIAQEQVDQPPASEESK